MARTDAAGGQGPAIDPAVVRRASAWMARLWSGEASAADRAACDAWLAAFAQEGPESLARAFFGLDEELQVLFLAASVTVWMNSADPGSSAARS